MEPKPGAKAQSGAKGKRREGEKRNLSSNRKIKEFMCMIPDTH
ncbi:MAG: hypothetical protein WC854_10890 [Bacteroidales bacterium]